MIQWSPAGSADSDAVLRRTSELISSANNKWEPDTDPRHDAHGGKKMSMIEKQMQHPREHVSFAYWQVSGLLFVYMFAIERYNRPSRLHKQ